jgi:hypothetical protein
VWGGGCCFEGVCFTLPSRVRRRPLRSFNGHQRRPRQQPRRRAHPLPDGAISAVSRPASKKALMSDRMRVGRRRGPTSHDTPWGFVWWVGCVRGPKGGCNAGAKPIHYTPPQPSPAQPTWSVMVMPSTRLPWHCTRPSTSLKPASSRACFPPRRRAAAHASGPDRGEASLRTPAAVADS